MYLNKIKIDYIYTGPQKYINKDEKRNRRNNFFNYDPYSINMFYSSYFMYLLEKLYQK
jgi:hypothetical protein